MRWFTNNFYSKWYFRGGNVHTELTALLRLEPAMQLTIIKPRIRVKRTKKKQLFSVHKLNQFDSFNLLIICSQPALSTVNISWREKKQHNIYRSYSVFAREILAKKTKNNLLENSIKHRFTLNAYQTFTGFFPPSSSPLQLSWFAVSLWRTAQI